MCNNLGCFLNTTLWSASLFLCMRNIEDSFSICWAEYLILGWMSIRLNPPQMISYPFWDTQGWVETKSAFDLYNLRPKVSGKRHELEWRCFLHEHLAIVCFADFCTSKSLGYLLFKRTSIILDYTPGHFFKLTILSWVLYSDLLGSGLFFFLFITHIHVFGLFLIFTFLWGLHCFQSIFSSADKRSFLSFFNYHFNNVFTNILPTIY